MGHEGDSSTSPPAVDERKAVVIKKRYVLQKELGAGASCKVYRAYDKETEKYVAVKLYEQWRGSEGQFAREVRNLKFLNKADAEGKHIYRHLDEFRQKDGKHVIVMELFEGKTIKQEISDAQKKGLPLKTIKSAILDIMEAFAFLGREDVGVLHGDIKPDNIILTKDGAKVIDFGLSYRNGTMQKNMYIQSRWYRSPEVLLGIPATHAIDMWSVGVLIAEMFLGFAPFRGFDSFDQMQRISEIICLPSENLCSKCEPTTLKKLNELVADVGKKQAKSEEKGGPPAPKDDMEAAERFKAKLMGHRKPKPGDNPTDVDLCVDLCSKLLITDPDVRLTALQCLEHPFLNTSAPVPETSGSPLSEADTLPQCPSSPSRSRSSAIRSPTNASSVVSPAYTSISPQRLGASEATMARLGCVPDSRPNAGTIGSPGIKARRPPAPEAPSRCASMPTEFHKSFEEAMKGGTIERSTSFEEGTSAEDLEEDVEATAPLQESDNDRGIGQKKASGKLPSVRLGKKAAAFRPPEQFRKLMNLRPS